MRSLIAAVALALLCTASASAATPSPSSDQLGSFVCQKALDPLSRSISVQATMRPVAGTAKLQMRFDLMRQLTPGARFTLVRGKMLGSWISPTDPTLGQNPADVWILTHPVVDLAAPATYHFRVAFRWIGAQGQQLSTAVQTGANCYQPELRPDLLVRSVAVTPPVAASATGTDVYTAVIANRGQTSAGPFQVVLAGAGSAPQTTTVTTLGPHSSAREKFVAPACTPGASLTVTVDPAHTIDEYDYANNALTIICPAPVPTPTSG
jgi:hypothetical protein